MPKRMVLGPLERKQAAINLARMPAERGRLLLNAGLLDHSGDMKPCHIGMGVII